MFRGARKKVRAGNSSQETGSKGKVGQSDNEGTGVLYLEENTGKWCLVLCGGRFGGQERLDLLLELAAVPSDSQIRRAVEMSYKGRVGFETGLFKSLLEAQSRKKMQQQESCGCCECWLLQPRGPEAGSRIGKQ